MAKKRAFACFRRLATTLGKEHGDCWKKVGNKNVAKIGCWNFDYNPTYGGGVVVEIINEGGGEDMPLGMGRQKTEEFCRSVEMIEKALEIDRSKRRKK